MSAIWDAQPEDTGSLILKHCRVSSSSKYEDKFASLWSTSVLCSHCLHRGVHHVTPHKLQFQKCSDRPDYSQPSAVLVGGVEPLTPLWGDSSLKHRGSGARLAHKCPLLTAFYPQTLLLFGTSESCSFVPFFLFNRKQTSCCVSILARNQGRTSCLSKNTLGIDDQVGVILQQE